MGVEHVNRFLAGLNIPGLHHKTFKMREREVTPYVADVAKASCTAALDEEIAVTLSSNPV